MKAFLSLVTLLISSCTVSSHPFVAVPVKEGQPLVGLAESAQLGGSVSVKVIKNADWAIDLKGLLDLDDPKVKAAGIDNRQEPIQIKSYLIEHPSKGRYLIDSGVAGSIGRWEKGNPLDGLLAKFFPVDTLKLAESTEESIQRNGEIKGVFLTHMHLDHMLGFPALDKKIDIYVGPGEITEKSFKNLPGRASTDDLLEGHRKITQLDIPQDNAAVDFFGDGSFYVISVPGHTPGSLAFLAKTDAGKFHLITGDTCHTQWGWDNEVPPGEFTADHEKNRIALKALRSLASSLEATVHLGHQ